MFFSHLLFSYIVSYYFLFLFLKFSRNKFYIYIYIYIYIYMMSNQNSDLYYKTLEDFILMKDF